MPTDSVSDRGQPKFNTRKNPHKYTTESIEAEIIPKKKGNILTDKKINGDRAKG